MKSLRKVEYLEWLKVQEEFILWTLSLSPASGIPPAMEVDQTRRESENELQIVREIKAIVQAYTGQEDKDE